MLPTTATASLASGLSLAIDPPAAAVLERALAEELLGTDRIAVIRDHRTDAGRIHLDATCRQLTTTSALRTMSPSELHSSMPNLCVRCRDVFDQFAHGLDDWYLATAWVVAATEAVIALHTVVTELRDTATPGAVKTLRLGCFFAGQGYLRLDEFRLLDQAGVFATRAKPAGDPAQLAELLRKLLADVERMREPDENWPTRPDGCTVDGSTGGRADGDPGAAFDWAVLQPLGADDRGQGRAVAAVCALGAHLLGHLRLAASTSTALLFRMPRDTGDHLIDTVHLIPDEGFDPATVKAALEHYVDPEVRLTDWVRSFHAAATGAARRV